jgi:hypothetical protein
VPHSGVDLGVDLYDLEKVAKDYLPTVAGVYADALARCGRAMDGVTNAPKLPEQFCDGFDTTAAYVALGNASAEVLGETQQNLADTAATLDQAAELYAATDQAAAAELNRLNAERGVPAAE